MLKQFGRNKCGNGRARATARARECVCVCDEITLNQMNRCKLQFFFYSPSLFRFRIGGAANSPLLLLRLLFERRRFYDGKRLVPKAENVK